MKNAENTHELKLISLKTTELGEIICPDCGGKTLQCRGAVVRNRQPVHQGYEITPVRISLDIDEGVKIQGLPNESVSDDFLFIGLQYICADCKELEDFYRLVINADCEGFGPRIGWVEIG